MEYEIEYQPLDEPRQDTRSVVNSFEQRERKYWILCLIVFFFEIVVTLLEFAYFFNQAVHHNGYNAIPLIVSLVGLIILSNGLFGNRYRGVSLVIYVIFFEVVPAIIKTMALIVMIFGYKMLKDEIQKIIDKEKWTTSASKLMAWLILLTTGFALIHVFSGTVIYRYKTIRRQREWYF